MALDAGSVFAVLGAKFMPTGFAQYDAAIKKSIASATKAETANKKAASSAAAVGVAKKAAVGGVVALGAAYLSTVAAAANFEQVMQEVKAVTKANAGEMKLMRNVALDLGAKTGIGARNAARGLVELSKGGLTAKQATAALKGTIDLAQAGSMDLADAATAVANAMNAFSLDGKDAGKVADAFAVAANDTTADVSDFAMALKQAGSASKLSGFSFKDTMVTLESLAKIGVKNSDAGTSLKTALIQLTKPTEKQAEAAKKYGLEFYKSNGTIKNAVSIAGMLRSKLSGLTKEQRLGVLATIAGTDGFRALAALYEQGGAGAGKLADKLGQSGYAADVAKTKLGGLKGEWQRFKAQVETISIKIGTPGLEWATSKLREVNNVMRRLEQMPDIGLSINSDGLAGDIAEIALQLDKLLVVFTVATDAAVAFGSTMGHFIPGRDKFDEIASGAQDATDAINHARESLQTLGGTRVAGQKLSIDEGDAVRAVGRLSNKKIRTVMRIVANSQDAETKINRIRALGIPLKYAKIIAAGAENVQAAIDAIHGKTVEIKFRQITTIETRRGRASGRGPGSSERSLVGEGGGPELVGNPRDGFGMVAGPTVMDLAPDDYVIPTEERYRGRAAALMAHMLGLPGFKKGKKAKKKRYLPDHVYAAHSLDYYQSAVSDLEGKKDERNKDQKLTGKAKKARRALPKARKELEAARKFKAQIDKATIEADIQSDLMRTADSKDDQKGYNAASKKRRAQLQNARRLLARALKLNPKANAWTQSIRAQMASLGAELADTPADPASVFGDVSEETYTAAEQKQIDAFDAAIAIAALTETKADDLDAEQQKERFLSALLPAVQASGGKGRGGATAIKDIATELKSTRDTITELTKPADKTADQQAIDDQAEQRGFLRGRTDSIDRLVAALGDGGSVGQRSTQVVFQSYVPPSPRQARELADHTVAGLSGQPARTSNRTKVTA